MAIDARPRVVIAALFKKMIVIRYSKENETAHYCCIFGHFNLLHYRKLDILCDTTTKLDVFVALQVLDNFTELYFKSVCYLEITIAFKLL